MSTISRHRAIVFLLLAILLGACDMHGPWDYYPEETETYRGVYTFGYVISGETPYVCFTKLYALEESAAENFAFYDSAHVTVSGKFGVVDGDEIAEFCSDAPPCWSNDMRPVHSRPNCFTGGGIGLPGESYTLEAFFVWDSAGTKVQSRYKAVANIPTMLKAKGIRPPSTQLHSKEPFYENTYDYMEFDFLEYPYDMYTYSIAMDYDETVQGILGSLHYDNEEGGESQNTTMMNMAGSFAEQDSIGYYGFSVNEPFEHVKQRGFETRMRIGGMNNLDTMFFMGMTMPIGKSTIYFYGTDQAYADYENYVAESYEDPRVVPKTNVENGMGVFAGMIKDSIMLEMKTENFITYDYMKAADCEGNEMDPDFEPWDNKYCRLYQDRYCVDTLWCIDGGCSPEYEVRQIPTCYPSLVKLAMTLDTNSWAAFLPDTASADKKNEAYADGLKRFCVASNFKGNSIAGCEQIYEDCQVNLEKNYCKEYLWNWCADRDWDIGEYSQCGTALVSRYYLEEQNSSILKREVEAWCRANPSDSQCKR